MKRLLLVILLCFVGKVSAVPPEFTPATVAVGIAGGLVSGALGYISAHNEQQNIMAYNRIFPCGAVKTLDPKLVAILVGATGALTGFALANIK